MLTRWSKCEIILVFCFPDKQIYILFDVTACTAYVCIYTGTLFCDKFKDSHNKIMHVLCVIQSDKIAKHTAFCTACNKRSCGSTGYNITWPILTQQSIMIIVIQRYIAAAIGSNGPISFDTALSYNSIWSLYWSYIW